MKTRFISNYTVATLALVIMLIAAVSLSAASPRLIQSFDNDWRFSKGDTPGAQYPAFKDAAWTNLNVPHDWAIEGPWAENNPTGSGGGYLPSGIAWYRKTFTLPASDTGKRVFINFDGIMGYADVWINGFHLGMRPNGYIPTTYEMTDHILWGESNVIAVKTNTTLQPASRWYAGAGIYRHVKLIVTDPVHIEHGGVHVTTPIATAERGIVLVRTSIINQSASDRTINISTSLQAPDGKMIAMVDNPKTTVDESLPVQRILSADESNTVSEYFDLASPKLWNPDDPVMYTAVTKISTQDGVELDVVRTSFGIRDAQFRAETGFWLNGKNIKLLGVCVHSDGGALGVAVPNDFWIYRLRQLKLLGVNAIRCAHNPPSSDFLDACDRLGLLVMNEMYDAWTVGKRPGENGINTYFSEWWEADLRDAVKRDRNHPSIILWSAGNEIHDTRRQEMAKNILNGIVCAFHRYDPGTPVTQGLILFRVKPGHDYENGLADMVDVLGTNYYPRKLLDAGQLDPTRKLIGTESKLDLETWSIFRDNPQMSGLFLWSGIDYLGESNWPRTTASFGVISRTGAFKPTSYERQSWWSQKPMVHIVRKDALPVGSKGSDRGQMVDNWTPREFVTLDTANITVYSNCDKVELFLNGRSLGIKPRETSDPDKSRTWNVVYASGTLKAVGKNGGKIVATHELKTAGSPAKLVLTASQPIVANDFDAVSVVTAQVVDADGVPIQTADNLIRFKISGPGVVAAIDNGDLDSHESFQATQRAAYHGECVAFIKANASSGSIKVTASADGLTDGLITLQAAPAQ
jgi:beta-galactosidase